MSTTSRVKTPNRRQSMRRKLRATVRLECREGTYGFGSNITQSVLDLSDTGVRLIVRRELKLNGELEVMISGYGVSERIKRVATVRWQVKLENETFCVGIEFDKRLRYRDWQILAAPNG